MVAHKHSTLQQGDFKHKFPLNAVLYKLFGITAWLFVPRCEGRCSQSCCFSSPYSGTLTVEPKLLHLLKGLAPEAAGGDLCTCACGGVPAGNTSGCTRAAKGLRCGDSGA